MPLYFAILLNWLATFSCFCLKFLKISIYTVLLAHTDNLASSCSVLLLFISLLTFPQYLGQDLLEDVKWTWWRRTSCLVHNLSKIFNIPSSSCTLAIGFCVNTLYRLETFLLFHFAKTFLFRRKLNTFWVGVESSQMLSPQLLRWSFSSPLFCWFGELHGVLNVKPTLHFEWIPLVYNMHTHRFWFANTLFKLFTWC